LLTYVGGLGLETIDRENGTKTMTRKRGEEGSRTEGRRLRPRKLRDVRRGNDERVCGSLEEGEESTTPSLSPPSKKSIELAVLQIVGVRAQTIRE
jgi:hypothetical protein